MRRPCVVPLTGAGWSSKPTNRLAKELPSALDKGWSLTAVTLTEEVSTLELSEPSLTL